MFYLIGQIALTLFFTALIGITMGWLLRGLGTSRQTEAIEARWRARLAQLKRHNDATAITTSPVAEQTVAQNSPVAEQKIAELQKQLHQRDESLKQLRATPNTAVKTDSASTDIANRLQETTELCTQLQLHVVEQKGTADQLRAEREMLVERLRDRESEIGRMSQERQHAINTIASLQKEMRTMRGAQAMAATQTPVATATSGRSQPPAATHNPAAPTANPTAPTANPVAPRAKANPAALTANPTAPTANPVAPKANPAALTANPTAPTPNPAVSMLADAATNQAPVERGLTHSEATRPASPVESTSTGQQNLPITDNNVSTSVSTYKPVWRLTAPNGSKDNLQAVFGIGPKLEMQLNQLGIFHFEQIAQFRRDDILWVAHRLKSFPGRIVRDRWVDQAQTLSQQKRN